MLNKKDFESKNEVRWCPGCGDHAVLTTLQKTLPELGIPKENIAVISGIGCASRLPFYLDVSGFHTIHGRAFPIATGLSLAREDLSIWVVTGDGDGLSIGLSHLMHMFRRNVNVKVLMFNNRIYGLTKGQYSPTSKPGQSSKTSLSGVKEKELNPIDIALTAGATFVARAIDVDAKSLKNIINQASQHKGSAFIEILQNCNVYNDGIFSDIKDKKQQKNNTIHLQHGEKLLFGESNERGIGFCEETMSLKVCEPNSALKFNKESSSTLIHRELASMGSEENMPVALGIFRSVRTDTFSELQSQKISTDSLFDKAVSSSISWDI